MIKDENVTFGATYVDDTTGFTGQATAHIRYSDMESQVQLEAKGADGRRMSEWFSIKRLSFAS